MAPNTPNNKETLRNQVNTPNPANAEDETVNSREADRQTWGNTTQGRGAVAPKTPADNPPTPPEEPTDQPQPARREQKANFGPKDLPNEAAMPTNRDMSQPEMQSLQATANAMKDDSKPKGQAVRISWRNSGLTDEDNADSVKLDNGFVVLKRGDRTTIYPAVEVSKVEFQPANIAWD